MYKSIIVSLNFGGSAFFPEYTPTNETPIFCPFCGKDYTFNPDDFGHFEWDCIPCYDEMVEELNRTEPFQEEGESPGDFLVRFMTHFESDK